ncbi:MAG TPA: hypothetical protein VGS23_06615, partial [Thermoplasmata archaeon]|nr:hypothetical protein [Thermoplasmata archaeon]
PIAPAGLLASVSVALYLEYLGWQFLWYVPRAWTDASPPLKAGAGPSLEERAAPATLRKLVHPFRFGRWTEAAKRWRSGLAPIPAEGPDPREFL